MPDYIVRAKALMPVIVAVRVQGVATPEAAKADAVRGLKAAAKWWRTAEVDPAAPPPRDVWVMSAASGPSPKPPAEGPERPEENESNDAPE